MGFLNYKPSEKNKWSQFGLRSVPNSDLPILDMLLNTSTQEYLSDSDAIYYYNNISIVGEAINKIVDAMAQVDLSVYDEEKKIYINYYSESLKKYEPQEQESLQKLLKILKMPSPLDNNLTFLSSLCKYFVATGTVYYVAYGNVNYPPIELEVVDSRHIVPNSNLNDRFPDSYNVNTESLSGIEFKRVNDSKAQRIRYIREDNLAELYCIHNMSTKLNSFVGVPFINSLKQEINQFFEGGKHNYALLKNGARLSGAFMTERTLSQKSKEDLKASLKAQFTGSQNAGSIALFDGGNFKYQNLSNNLRDMDFKDLRKMLQDAIYNGLDIPLAMVDPEAMGQSSSQVAYYYFYKNNVLPKLTYVLTSLSRLMMHRYEGLSFLKFCVSYIPFNIPVIRNMELENIQKLERIYAVTVNERRRMLNMQDIENGDQILVPANTMPLDIISEYYSSKKDNTNTIGNDASNIHNNG